MKSIVHTENHTGSPKKFTWRHFNLSQCFTEVPFHEEQTPPSSSSKGSHNPRSSGPTWGTPGHYDTHTVQLLTHRCFTLQTTSRLSLCVYWDCISVTWLHVSSRGRSCRVQWWLSSPLCATVLSSESCKSPPGPGSSWSGQSSPSDRKQGDKEAFLNVKMKGKLKCEQQFNKHWVNVTYQALQRWDKCVIIL